MKRLLFPYLVLCVTFFSCGSDDGNVVSQNPTNPNPTNPTNPTDTIPTNPNPTNPSTTLKYLALGDSYTIGQNVCETCRFPAQLKTALENAMPSTAINLSVIATTGWTTTNLISNIQTQNPANDQDLVTLLIGVNNQYQHKPFSLYEQEFPQLVATAIALAKGDKDNVIVVSIPDYAFTPFGQGYSNPSQITTEIAQYNTFAQNYCQTQGIVFVNITDITQNGLQNPSLVASDGLHPSASAYSQFVQRLLPKALSTLP
ncbi:SGNH/GDSL hydrolase family protein [Flavobacterium sp.]|uniref:SGNH/GDSL hydrolase family protein n=1 Tax=Flavobacterium sp. TaxID=239 RepID=UPI0011FD774E|nr:SGNH/GDSL hydrolase family protein [Flavobacterium sp.]RZJ69343.1 MAG: SGNH/GDSL hydrolase family protein [Flavobacterium sp.]